jgi:hypothetical protein
VPPPAASPGAADALCRQSKTAADAGQIEAAAELLQRCTSGGGSAGAQATARNAIRSAAAREVTRRAFRQNCAGARSAAAAARSVGVGDRAEAALGRTSCGG